MTDLERFELDLASALRADADRHVIVADMATVARTAIERGARGRLGWLPSRWIAGSRLRPGRIAILVAVTLVVLTIVAVALVGGFVRRPPTVLPDRAITVVSQADGLVDVDLTTRLAKSTPGCVGGCLLGEAPSWSPDGTRLAYLAEGVVWVVDIANATSRGLTACCAGSGARLGWPHPGLDWSPDGTRIAYGDGQRLFTIDVDGGAPVAVTPESGNASQPAWSPDGSRIAFTWRGDLPGIYTIRVDGTDMRPVAVSRADPATSPGWSPDGSRIAYITDPPSDQAFTANLWTARTNGTDARVLFQVPGCCVNDWGDLSWSGDGTRIATILGPGYGRLYVVDVGDGHADQWLEHVRPGAIGWRPAE